MTVRVASYMEETRRRGNLLKPSGNTYDWTSSGDQEPARRKKRDKNRSRRSRSHESPHMIIGQLPCQKTPKKRVRIEETGAPWTVVTKNRC